MNNFTVYLHRNKENHKVYVGITCQKVNNRWRNGNGYTNKELKKDIKKYGWDGFEHIIICENLTEQEAKEKEKELVAFFNSNNEQYGYNKTNGGDVAGMMGKHQSNNTKMSISKKLKKRVFTQEHKKHISDAKSGINHHLAKAVYQYSKNGTFIKKWDYMNEAAKVLNINKGNIAEVCYGNRKSAGGFVWSYERR